MFAGQYEDAESGWAYNRFRYYNPTLGAYNRPGPTRTRPTPRLSTRLRRPRSILGRRFRAKAVLAKS
ncbi:RHS repeat-associated core domain-containing protein [Corynebacterium macclintockiae]|uniref:RHS repeat-associated core domain-containing protein n=1 Tax=Corynebacterium macclintockiae TaxID=2913501 RepID=UPI003EBEE2BB